MSWSYSGDPSASTRNQVRFLLQDTDERRQLLQDEEVDWLLVEYANVQRAAAEGALVIAARFAALPDRKIGGMSISYSTNARHYHEIATSLRRRAAKGAMGAPMAGGLTRTEIDDRLRDTELVTPLVYLGIHDGAYAQEGFWGSAWGRY